MNKDSFYALSNTIIQGEKDLLPLVHSLVHARVVENDKKSLFFYEAGAASFSNYLNSFSEIHLKYLEKKVDFFYFSIHVQGSFRLRLMRSMAYRADEIVLDVVVEAAALYELPVSSMPGIIYFELEALVPGSIFFEAAFGVHKDAVVRDVKLGIVACTYKKEIDVKRNVSLLCTELSDICSQVFVVDNGQTLGAQDFPEGVRLFSQENTGGSGGFGRGMQEVHQDSTITHTVLMDDDVFFLSEVVRRVARWFAVLHADCSLSGAMFDSKRKYSIFELGARFDGLCRPLVYNMPQVPVDSMMVAGVLLSCHADYGAWWFYAYPTEWTRAENDLPLPLFIRADDIEIGLRFKKRGKKILSLPSGGLWHEPFYTKSAIWMRYYSVRNELIVSEIYKKSVIKNTLAQMRDALKSLYFHNYTQLSAILDACTDFLGYTSLHKKYDSHQFHKKILSRYKEDKVPLEWDLFVGCMQKKVSILVLVKNIIKNIVIDPPEGCSGYMYPNDLPGENAKNHIVVYSWEEKMSIFVWDRKKFLEGFLRLLVIFSILFFVYPFRKKRYRYESSASTK